MLRKERLLSRSAIHGIRSSNRVAENENEKEGPKVNVSINGREYKASPSQTILEVAREHNQFIPTLCYHPMLKPVGTCRLCLVDTGGNKTVC